MQSKLQKILSRADTQELTRWLGDAASELVHLLDKNLIYPAELLKLVLGIKSESGLLEDSSSRTDIFYLLRPNEARHLVSLISGNTEISDPYKALNSTDFRTRKNRTELYNFFEVPLPMPEINIKTPDTTKCVAGYPLFAHQIDALERTRIVINQELGRVLLHMPTGSGKTRTAMNLVADYLREKKQGVVIWLAHSEELCDQSVQEFEKAWQMLGNRDIGVYRYYGCYDSDLSDITDGFVVAGFAKLVARTKADTKVISILARLRPFVVMDEAHKAIAPTYKLLLDILAPANCGGRLLGLSATPGRTWDDIEEDQKLSQFFGSQKITLQIQGYTNPIHYLVEQEYLAHTKYRRLKCDSKVELTDSERQKISENLELPESYLKRLGADAQRTLQLILEIEKLVLIHKRIIVFATSVDQSELLATVLFARGLKARSITAKTEANKRALSIKNYQNHDSEPFVLCNYGVLTTGFDAPRTSAVLIARPTLSLVLYSQMVGRAIRGIKAGGNAKAEIVTVIDSGLPGFDSVESAFSNWEDVWKKI